MSLITQRFQNIYQLNNHYFEIIGVGSIGSAGGMEPGYASKDIKKVGSTSSAYSSKNISAN